jgi:hypothetical protein
MKIIEKLSTYAALVGVIGAIGGGFYAWGEFNTRLSALENEPPINLQPLKTKDKELEKQFDDVLLYANEYKVDLIDRIKKVDDKIQPVDLTAVFKEIGKVKEQIAMLDIPEPFIIDPILAPIRQTIKSLESVISELSKQVAIALKENELQDSQIEEIKLESNNPLSN